MIQAKNILSTTTNATGNSFNDLVSGGAFQAVITGTGAITATINIQCSLDNTNWILLGTITLSGTTTATDGFTSSGGWIFYRAVSSNVTGIVTSIIVNMSEEL